MLDENLFVFSNCEKVFCTLRCHGQARVDLVKVVKELIASTAWLGKVEVTDRVMSLLIDREGCSTLQAAEVAGERRSTGRADMNASFIVYQALD
jgi:hypothetical protein